jgi:hypothetical protein
VYICIIFNGPGFVVAGGFLVKLFCMSVSFNLKIIKFVFL